MNEEQIKKVIFEVSEKYEVLLPMLETLPDLIELLIENYRLNATDYSEKDVMKLGTGHEKIYSVLLTVLNTLEEYRQQTANIRFDDIVSEI